MKCLSILVDALNPVYLAHMPGLAKLAKESTSGRMREPLGFTPREAYFGGLSPNQVGYTHMFEPHVSGVFNPFSLAMEFPPYMRPKLDAVQRYVQPSFASHYASSLKIPWELLPHFGIAERYSPWDPRKGYRSIFDELAEQRRSWSYIGWPYHREPDESLCRRAESALRSGTDFVFLHLSELDGAGHAYGPNSRAVMELAGEQDRRIQRLLSHSSDRNLLVFGDHGMVAVTKHLRIDLSWVPQGVLYFVDSTSIRFWAHPHEHSRIRKHMASRPGLFELSSADLVRYRADLVPNGLVFWAEPGCVFTPNFFGSEPVKGMHGYLPEIYDNESFFILAGAGIGSIDTTAIEAADIHSLLKGQLGLASLPLLPQITIGKYSRVPDADPIVQAALDEASAIIRTELPEIYGLHLSGSFGRGEGTVENERLVNDLDLVYEAKVPPARSKLDAAAERIRASLGLSFVDLSPLPPIDRSQYDHDFRYGSITLFGDSSAVETRPAVAADEIGMANFDRLLLNRIAGLLSADFPPNRGDINYRHTQVIKLGIALAQRLLAEANAYHHCYYICLQRLDLLPLKLRPYFRLCLESKLFSVKLEDAQLEGVVNAVRLHLRENKVIKLPKGLRSRLAWRHARIYRRLHRSFMQGAAASPNLIQAWFSIIH